MQELISVIIPVFNAEATLKNCMDSVLQQRYENIEVLLVDDGSKDASKKICEHYVQADDRVRFYPIANHGVSYARNYALERAKGVYVAFVDADDTVEMGIYEMLVQSLENSGAQMAVCGFYQEDAQHFEQPMEVLGKEEKVFDSCGACQLAVLQGGGYAWNKLVSQELLKEHGIVFDEEVRMCEDLLFFFQISCWTEKISYIPQPLYHYLYNGKSACNRGVNEYTLTFMEAYRKIEQSCKDLWIRKQLIYLYINNIINHISLVVNDTGNQKTEKYLKQLKKEYRRCMKQYPLASKQKIYYLLLKISPKLSDKMYTLRKCTRKNSMVHKSKKRE